MELVKTYEDYKNISQRYTVELELLTNEAELNYVEEKLQVLEGYKSQFEALMDVASTLEVEEDESQNLKDLKYLLTDSYFLALDVAHFYKIQEMGRFKLRALNYLNKKRRSEMFI